MNKWFFIFSIFLMGGLVVPSYSSVKKEDHSKELLKLLHRVKNRYQKAPSVKMDFTKKIKSSFGFDQKSEGFFKGLFKKNSHFFRLEVPEKTLLVFDGKNIWSVTYPPKGFKGPVQVIQGSNDQIKGFDQIWSSLFGTEEIEKNFKISSMKWEQNGEEADYSLQPKSKKIILQSFRLKINHLARVIQELSYKDDLDNWTTYTFKNIRLTEKIEKTEFSFKPPKGAVVEKL